MLKILKEFKSFAMKGNVMDLAIGVIIGQAFGKIVSSLVGDIITPLLTYLTGNAALVKDLKFHNITYGNFIQSIIDFLIIAASIFLAIKGFNQLKKPFEKQRESEAKAAVSKTELLLEEIRDLLKAGK